MKLLIMLMIGGALGTFGLFALSGELSQSSTTFKVMLGFVGAFAGAAIWIKAVAFQTFVDEDNSRILRSDDE
jgi:uncharacterized membrane protein YeaQ/YmgE (transglycosylase-associated protein family)